MNANPPSGIVFRARGYLLLRWGAHVVLLAAIGLISWQLVIPLRAKPEIRSQSSTSSIDSPKPIDMHAAGQLFGASASSASAASPTVQQTDVTLAGIIAADNPADSLAIVEIQGEERTLSVGAALPDGEVLKAVTSRGVILANGPQEREVDFTQPEAALDAVFPTLPVQITGGEAATPVSPIPVTKPAPIVPAAQQMIQLRQAALQTLVNRSRRPPPPATTFPPLPR